MTPTVSVVIPTLEEAEALPRLLDDLDGLRRRMAPGTLEIVIADGGSTDGTRTIARRQGARVVRSGSGRGRQLRAGVAAAHGEWLFLVHADCRVPDSAADALSSFLVTAPPERAGHFRYALDADGWWARGMERGQRLRERWTGLVYGDQGLVISRRLLSRVGGVPDWPLMEDVGLVDRIRRHGELRRLDAELPTSPRRYRREGGLRAILRNLGLITLFRLGVDPERLVRWYGGSGGASSSDDPLERVLLVFAKAPRPGTVKTRLAADVGDDRAARIYRRMGRTVVDAVRSGDHRTRVCFAPSNAEEELRAWLGEEELEYRVQCEGDLGRRMERAFADAFAEGADRVCVVGTDAPGVDRTVVDRAFAELEEAPVVLGPARDGGYYLLALRRPHPELFQDIPWSTDRVLERTRSAARRAGLGVHLLPERVDVDRVEDLPPELASC